MTPVFDNILHCMSLSKAGLEAVGIQWDAQLIQVLESFQTNMCLHPSRYGQAIAAPAINSGGLAEIATQVIRPCAE